MEVEAFGRALNVEFGNTLGTVSLVGESECPRKGAKKGYNARGGGCSQLCIASAALLLLVPGPYAAVIAFAQATAPERAWPGRCGGDNAGQHCARDRPATGYRPIYAAQGLVRFLQKRYCLIIDMCVFMPSKYIELTGFSSVFHS